MAVTRSSVSERAQRVDAVAPPSRRYARNRELIYLLCAAVIVLAGLTLVFQAKQFAMGQSAGQKPLNLNEVDRREELLPILGMFQSPGDRQFVADRIYNYLSDRTRSLPNVGTLSNIRVSPQDVGKKTTLDVYQKRFADWEKHHANSPDARMPLLTGTEISEIKPLVVVRPASAFVRPFFLWCGIVLVMFFAVHFFWRARGFQGNQALLPMSLLMSGLGLILMVSLRDPLRDMLSFVDFAQGIAGGLVLLAILSLMDLDRTFGGLSFVPLLLSLVLSGALIVFGSGPGTSDAKVNLFGFQPVELIKILLIFFLAGYFARRWELLREVRERRRFPFLSKWMNIPRLEHVMPLMFGIAVALLFFFLQRDLGPALVIASLFFILYAVARQRFVLAASGFLFLLGGFLVGYYFGVPHTVEERVQMWLSPWNNSVRGGDQVVHSLWALASGGPWGSGLGLGNSEMIPAGYTDLILAVLGEQLGLLGVWAALALLALMTYIGLRIALRAATDYSFFLALGLTLLLALQTLLIAGGILDLFPLSGVVTPFLSYGRSSMFANFAIIGMLLAISRRHGDPSRNEPFFKPVRYVGIALAIAGAAIAAKAAYVGTVNADNVVGAGTLVLQADGGRRFEYNPRLIAIAKQIPRGTIYDRNGIPLATSDWKLLDQNKQQFTNAGIALDQCCNKNDARQYPLGPVTFHLLGNINTHLNWNAPNASYIEKDQAVTLQGYDDRARVVEVRDFRTKAASYTIRYDYRELIPLLRHRYEPNNPEARRILDRNRDIHTSIDARLQMRAFQILRAGLQKASLQKGSIVVMDPANGDVLALVNYPAPDPTGTPIDPNQSGRPELLDRARYGLFPPGSTFKMVTALAALKTNPDLANAAFNCVSLGDGRVGAYLQGWNRPIRDDVQDKTPHGHLTMERAVQVSCNAYFAQLGWYKLGSAPLLAMGKQLGISVANPPTVKQLQPMLPQAAYGQGQVVASPFQLARVAALIAAGGQLPYGRWITDASNPRTQAPQPIVSGAVADTLGKYMREVVTGGTGTMLANSPIPIAGKTGTAELANAPSHSWFIGYAPYGPVQGRRLAFAVLAENGQYGGKVAAPMAGDVVAAANDLGLFQENERP